MGWTSHTLAGHTVDVFEPAGVDRPRFGLLYLHSVGRETLVEKDIYTRLLEKYRLPCVCPHGHESWWVDRICTPFDDKITPERYVLDRVVPYFAERWRLAPRAIGLFGVSMGGQGALRLAFKHPEIFPVVAGISSAIDFHEWYGQGMPMDDMYDSPEQVRQDTATLHVPPHHPPPHIFFCIDPDDAPWYRGNDRLHEKLSALGVPHTADLTTRAGGHSWEYFNNMAEPVLKFLVSGLEQESRRLL